VTGGAGTLALYAARALLEHGCDQIFLWDLPSQWGQPDFVDSYAQLQAEFGLPENPKRLQLIRVDVTSPESVSAAAAVTLANSINARIDMLCCFAGVVGCQHFLDLKPEEYKRVMDVNTTGTFLCSQAVAKQMASQSPPGGSIVHISCTSHFPSFPLYSTAHLRKLVNPSQQSPPTQ
jgi:NAD(P)-dependent dehydrogenase (short-subunit alcohol dehydrogenase family)